MRRIWQLAQPGRISLRRGYGSTDENEEENVCFDAITLHDYEMTKLMDDDGDEKDGCDERWIWVAMEEPQSTDEPTNYAADDGSCNA